MKRTTAAILCIVMILLCGCGVQEAAPAPAPTETPAPTEAPAPTETPAPVEETVKTEPGYARLFSTPAILAYLERGTQGEIIGEQENYYLFRTEEYCGYVEKRLLRTEDETPFEPYKLHLRQGVEVYPDYHLYGPKLMTVETPADYHVVAQLDDCFEIDADGTVGFVDVNATATNHYGGGSGGGRENDGQDIPVRAGGSGSAVLTPLSCVVAPKTGNSIGKAETKVDGTELITVLYELGEELAVIGETDGVCTVYFDEAELTMPGRFIRMEGEAPYESWKGYAVGGTKLYESIYMRGDYTKLFANTELTVLDEFDTCYLVKVNKTGELGYVELDCVSENMHGRHEGSPTWTDPKL